MSPARPAGWRTTRNRYNALTRDLAAKAKAERDDQARKALRLCLLEIQQFHSQAYPECDGGCPAHEAMAAAEAALKATAENVKHATQIGRPMP